MDKFTAKCAEVGDYESYASLKMQSEGTGDWHCQDVRDLNGRTVVSCVDRVTFAMNTHVWAKTKNECEKEQRKMEKSGKKLEKTSKGGK